MSVYDTNFFVEYFYSKDSGVLGRAKSRLLADKNRYVSTIVLHEIYKISLEKEGREVAEIRSRVIQKDFKIIGVDQNLAVLSAQIRHKYGIPMADSMIAATAKHLNTECVTNDHHIRSVKEIRCSWID